MGQIKVTPTAIPGLFVLEPALHGDSRGYFMESYNQRELLEEGLDMVFVQDNQSMSVRGVLRGLHFQKKHPQGKLVRAVSGAVYDVAVDLRPGSASFGRWQGEILSAENRKQFYIPPGFAHGFLVLSGRAEICYKATDFYHPEDEGGLLWNDPDLAIAWPDPGAALLLSEKDKKNALFRDYCREKGI